VQHADSRGFFIESGEAKMASPFSRSERFLKSDRFHGAAWGLLLVAILLGLWLLWFFRARVTVYAVSDSAELEVDRAAHSVGSQFTGRVVASSLALDREVQQGEVLIELDADTQKLQLNEERTRLIALGPQIASLEDQVAAEQKAWTQEQQAASVALDEARAHHVEAESAAHFAETEAERLKQMYAAGVYSKVDWERAQADAQQRRAAADSLRFALIRVERQQGTEEQDRRARAQGLMSEVNRLRGLQATTGAEIKRLEDEVDRRLIRAPVAGRLGEVANLRVGSVVREGDKLAAVVPQGTLRIIASFQPPDALGRIHPGQYARMQLAGFPWTQFGSLSGTVTKVASEVRDGAIRVEATVNPDLASRIPMQHGLPGTVEVEVEQLSPASLVLRMAGRLLARQRATLASAAEGATP
jgi:membrane fusion protein (multidrug efflux system)